MIRLHPFPESSPFIGALTSRDHETTSLADPQFSPECASGAWRERRMLPDFPRDSGGSSGRPDTDWTG